jgi:NADH:ubiquinone oxidoreductase subunit C
MVDVADVLQKGEEILNGIAKEIKRPEDNRVDVIIEPRQLLDAAKALTDNSWGYLSAITGLDHAKLTETTPEGKKVYSQTEGDVEVLYHFCNGAAVITLRVTLPYQHAEIDSVCGILPLATLYEREASELFGITFKNTPDSSKLLLPDDWPAGIYPLRKAFDGVNPLATSRKD